MRIYEDLFIDELEARSWNAEYFWDILHQSGKEKEFLEFAEEEFPNGLELSEFNDWIYFEAAQIFEDLGIDPENPTGAEPAEYDEYWYSQR